MKETSEEIRDFKNRFEEFAKNNDSSHAILLGHILREASNSNSSATTGETLGFISIFMGLISLLIVGIIEGTISPLIGKYLVFVFFVGALVISIFNFKNYLNNRKQAKEINSFIQEIISN